MKTKLQKVEAAPKKREASHSPTGGKDERIMGVKKTNDDAKSVGFGRKHSVDAGLL